MGQIESDRSCQLIADARRIFAADLICRNARRIGFEGQKNHIQHRLHVKLRRLWSDVGFELLSVDGWQRSVEPLFRLGNAKLRLSDGFEILLKSMLVIVSKN